ncbi:IclR family transcriptional regulator [Granulosicoccus antarcticus]|nr:IclR family transcriptional regulator [Granulosicoccus antarcticus]
MSDETQTRSPKGSTVTRVLDILDAVADSEHPLSPTDIAAQLSIPKASVHRLCAALEEHGYVTTRLNGRGLQAGHRLNRLALNVLSGAPLQAQRQAILSALSREIGETCNIAVPDGAEMIYFDRAQTHWPVQVNLKIGTRVPMYATAGGKMYLSTLSDARRDRIILNTHMERLTPNTLLSHDDLKEDLIATRERGYSLDNEEYIEGVVAMAMPIKNHQGRLYATLSFHAPCMRLPISAVSDFLPQLRAASEQLSALLDE